MSTKPFLSLLSKQQIDTIRRHSEVRDHDLCRAWGGHISVTGYGVFSSWRRPLRTNLYAHRVVWAIANNKDPGDFCVLHKCNNKSCVNPRHLYLGTQKENFSDLMRTGYRLRAKISVEIADKIRSDYANGDTQTAIASLYGISQPQVCRIVGNKQWKPPAMV